MNSISKPTASVEEIDGSALFQSLLEKTVDRIQRAAAPQVQPMELRSFDELERWAERAARSDMVPKDFKGKPDNIIIAVQMGAELGLRPMQSLINIAVINGRPSVWGDAMLALCKMHPSYVSTEETISGEGDSRVAKCVTIRRGEPPVVRTFSVADAKLAKLWNKKGYNGQDTPWVTNPDRMLQLRARGFALRDAFPDKLRGLISAEEANDIPPQGYPTPAVDSRPEKVTANAIGDEIPDHPAPKRPSVKQWLDAFEADMSEAMAAVDPRAAFDALMTRDDVRKAEGGLKNGAKERFDSIVQTAVAQISEADGQTESAE
jgi:RecT family